METLHRQSACPLDCPDHCSLDVTLERADATEPWRVAAVDGDERNPLTGGAICGKVRRMGDRVHGPERLTRPMRRVRGTKELGSYPRDFEPCSWDEALDLAAGRLGELRDEHGGEAILPISYGGSNGPLTEGVFDERLWRRLGASRLHRTLCWAPGGAAHAGLVGKMPGVDLRDYEHAELIVLWGINPKDSGMHLLPPVKKAVAAGAKVVVVDPRTTSVARAADLHLAPRPGTDLCLALALIELFFDRGWVDRDFLDRHTNGAEDLRRRAIDWSVPVTARRCGLDPADIERFAELFHRAAPAVVRVGYGVERNRNGGSALAAIMALPLVAGKFDGSRGGGFTASMSRAFDLDLEPAIDAPPVDTRLVNINQVGRTLLEADPPVRAVVVYDCNPASTLPEQGLVRAGLARDDLFCVVHEQAATDTCHFADLVLPATTFLEHEELSVGYGAPWLTHAAPVLDPVGEARPNGELFTALLDRLGLARPGDHVTAADVSRSLLRTAGLSRAQTAALEATGGTLPADELHRGAPPIPFVDHLPRTVDGRAHLFPAALDAEARRTGPGLYVYRPHPEEADGGEGGGAHPLTLISPALGRMITSTFGELLEGTVPLVIHAEDAAERGIAEGAPVRVFNDRGELRTVAALRAPGLPGAAGRDAPRRGTVVLPKGLWARHTDDGWTSNRLCPDDLTDLGAGSTYNDARVQVEAL